MEDSDFFKMFRGKPLENRTLKQSQGITFRNAPLNQAVWKNGSQTNDTGQLSTKVGDKQRGNRHNNTYTIPYKLSEAESAAKRRDDICYTCDEKWSKAHNCCNRKVYVIVVLKEDEMDEEFHDSVEDVNDMVVEVMELSLFSFFGRSSPTTTKMCS